MNFKRIDAEKAAQLFPNFIDIDRTEGKLNAIIFTTPQGVFRVVIRNYSDLHLEQHEAITVFKGIKVVIKGKGFLNVEAKEDENQDDVMFRAEQLVKQLDLTPEQYSMHSINEVVE